MLIDRLATILPDDTTPTIFREEYFVVSLVQEAGYSFEFTWLRDNIEIWVFRKSLLSPNLNIHFGGSRFVSWTDPLFHETDPRIRIQIQIKMKRNRWFLQLNLKMFVLNWQMCGSWDSVPRVASIISTQCKVLPVSSTVLHFNHVHCSAGKYYLSWLNYSATLLYSTRLPYSSWLHYSTPLH